MFNLPAIFLPEYPCHLDKKGELSCTNIVVQRKKTRYNIMIGIVVSIQKTISGLASTYNYVILSFKPCFRVRCWSCFSLVERLLTLYCWKNLKACINLGKLFQGAIEVRNFSRLKVNLKFFLSINQNMYSQTWQQRSAMGDC